MAVPAAAKQHIARMIAGMTTRSQGCELPADTTRSDNKTKSPNPCTAQKQAAMTIFLRRSEAMAGAVAVMNHYPLVAIFPSYYLLPGLALYAPRIRFFPFRGIRVFGGRRSFLLPLRLCIPLCLCVKCNTCFRVIRGPSHLPPFRISRLTTHHSPTHLLTYSLTHPPTKLRS